MVDLEATGKNDEPDQYLIGAVQAENQSWNWFTVIDDGSWDWWYSNDSEHSALWLGMGGENKYRSPQKPNNYLLSCIGADKEVYDQSRN